VHYHTEDGTAVEGVDFEGIDGVLTMEHQELKKPIFVRLLDGDRRGSEVRFRVVLTEPSAGSKFSACTDGGEDQALCDVVIRDVGLTRKTTKFDRLAMWIERSKGQTRQLGSSTWVQQITEAFYVGGDADAAKEASISEWIMHIIAFPWKMIFALCPPTDLCGGWLSFYSALAMIAGVTVLVSDLATFLGCVIGIPSEITAITLVALGTSLPDTFASKVAA